jgi:predicted PurR-regulated permease PerM
MPDVQHSPLDVHRILRWTIFLGAAAFVVYLCLQILSPFVNVIAWSTVLAITFHPVHAALVRRTHQPALSAILSSALVVIVFVVPLLFVASLAVTQFVAVGESFGRTFGGPGVDTTTPLGQVYAWVTRTFDLDATAIIDWFRRHATEIAQNAAGYTVAIAASLTSAVLSFIFIIFAMFLLFRDGDRMVARIPDLLPFDRARSEALLLRIRDVIYGGVYGVVVIALLQGALLGGMFWLLGIPSAALWGMVTVVTSVLPIFGAAAVWVPGAVYLGIVGQWTQAIVLLAWGTLVISGVDNFLRPRLVGGRVGLSEIVMFFSLLGGLQVFGILGIVLGPVLFAIVASIIDVLSEEPASENMS